MEFFLLSVGVKAGSSSGKYGSARRGWQSIELFLLSWRSMELLLLSACLKAGSSSGKHGSARRDWPFIEFFLLKTGDMGMELLPEFFLLRVGVKAGRSSEK